MDKHLVSTNVNGNDNNEDSEEKKLYENEMIDETTNRKDDNENEPRPVKQTSPKEDKQVQPNTLTDETYKGNLQSDLKSSNDNGMNDAVSDSRENENNREGEPLHKNETETLDTMYDDTKPRRLPKTSKQDLELESNRLMQGIDKLISPDELTHRSPTRRVGVTTTSNRHKLSETERKMSSEHADVRNKEAVSDTSNNYFKYPDIDIRSKYKEPVPGVPRKCSDTNSDVHLINRENEEVLNVSSSEYGAESGYKSDSSSELSVPGYAYSRRKELNCAMETDSIRTVTPPIGETSFNSPETTDLRRETDQDTRSVKDSTFRQSADMLKQESEMYKAGPRKTSADANLGRHNEIAEYSDIQPARKRRVSFGMVAYLKRQDAPGHDVSPLNDEIKFIVDSKCDPTINGDMEEPGIQDHFGNKDTMQGNRNIPTKLQIISDGTLSENDKRNFYQYTDGVGLTSEKGCDNPAYVTDRTDDGQKSAYNTKLTEDLQNEHDSLQELQVENLRRKRISTHSLPIGVGLKDTKRASWQSDESPVPKSILKNKTASSESLTSDSSMTNKKFKVRKDSIALFTDKHGNMGLAELRKQYSSDWKQRLNIKRIWSKRREILRNYKTNFFVFGLFICILAFVIVGLHLHNQHKENLAIAQKIFFDAKGRRLYLYEKDEKDQVSGTLGLEIPKWLLPVHCYEDYEKIHDKTCLIWKNFGTLNIQFTENKIKCYNISWKMEPGVIPHDCVDLGNNYWYGPSNSSAENWPISWNSFTFDTNSAKHDSGTFEFVTEYYWLSSSGGAIFVDSTFPLHVTWNNKNDGKLCFSVSKSGDFYSVDKPHELTMSYVICNGDNILSTHAFISEKFIPNLLEIPDMSLMMSPHWSTASENKKNKVSEDVILDLTTQLIKHNLNCSTIELDGQWERKTGDFSFDKLAFPNITKTLSATVDAKCEFSMNLSPYFDINSRNFAEGLSRELFIKSIGEQVPALVKWQNGIGAMLDVSNSTAREWFTSKVRHLKSSYGIDTFRFAYGNSFWLPHKPVFSQDTLNPNGVKKLFTDLFSTFGDIVIESTSQTQHISGFIGVSSSVINHGKTNCLKNIISDALNLGHLGYPLVMSDGIEVEAGLEEQEYRRPSRDLFIRWMQMSVFFPSMRFTIKPWEYDNEVVSVARNLSVFHEETVISEINQLEKQILQGKPIIRPLWWLVPNDQNTFQINDQFLLGDRYLVAPVLCEGKAGIAKRNIYVPKGYWRDIVSNTLIPGPKWINDYQVRQNEIPYFRQEELHFSVQ